MKIKLMVEKEGGLMISCRVTLALCLLSLGATTLSEGQNAFPSEHGLTFEKNPEEEASSAMIAFFGGPKPNAVELPEALNASDPRNSPTHRTTSTHQNSGNTNSSSRQNNTAMPAAAAAIVFALLVGVGLVAVAAAAALGMAYLLHSRRSKIKTCSSPGSSSSSSSLLSLTHWKGGSQAVQLGAVV